MTYALAGAMAIALCFVVMASIAAWSRKRTVFRGAAVTLAWALTPVVAIAALIGVGLPIPLLTGLTAPSGESLKVLGVRMDMGSAIYVMLDRPGEPRLFSLPWNDETANKLQQMLDDPATEDKGGIWLKLSDQSLDTSTEVASPPPSSPDPVKNGEDNAPRIRIN